MNQKTAIVTGANSGMGFATCQALIQADFHIIMACRNVERGQQALQTLQQQYQTNHIELITCDLGSLESIRSFVETFRHRYETLDVLINNAGVVTIKRHTTMDGFESMIGINHLGHFLLTNLLIEPLKQSKQGRIITVSSAASKAGNIHINDLQLTKGFHVIKGYSQSKLANILFTRELASQLSDTAVTANCLDPGAVSTNLGVNRETGFGKAIHASLRPFFLTPSEGADTAIYLATDPEISYISGKYFRKRNINAMPDRAQDNHLAKQLWSLSRELTKIQEHKYDIFS